MAGLSEACDGPHKQAACLKRRRQGRNLDRHGGGVGRTLDRHGGGVGSLEGPPVDLRVGLLPLRLSVCLCLPVCLSRSPSRSLSLSLVTAPGVAVTPPPPCHLRRCVRPVRPAERGRASSAPGAERSGGPRRNGGANLTTGSVLRRASPVLQLDLQAHRGVRRNSTPAKRGLRPNEKRKLQLSG